MVPVAWTGSEALASFWTGLAGPWKRRSGPRRGVGQSVVILLRSFGGSIGMVHCDNLPGDVTVECGMQTIYIVGTKEDFAPHPGPKKRTPRGASRYTVRCKGLTEEERSELVRELDRRFQIVPIARRNPTLPSVNWHEVFHIALLVGGAAVPTLRNLLESVVKKRLAKGKKVKIIELFGPDGKVVRRFRKPPLP